MFSLQCVQVIKSEGFFVACIRTAAGESLLALQIGIYVVAAARAAEMKARRGGFGG
jgi:hypothetical protein